MLTITEERLFSVTGQMIARTTTPLITNLKDYRARLGSKVAGVSRHHYDGQPGLCFLLLDGRMLIALFSSTSFPQD